MTDLNQATQEGLGSEPIPKDGLENLLGTVEAMKRAIVNIERFIFINLRRGGQEFTPEFFTLAMMEEETRNSLTERQIGLMKTAIAIDGEGNSKRNHIRVDLSTANDTDIASVQTLISKGLMIKGTKDGIYHVTNSGMAMVGRKNP